MNEEKLNQILSKIGQTDVPQDISLFADSASRNFSACLNIPRPRQSFLTPLKLIAAAAIIIVTFFAGRLSTPAASPETAAYTNITASVSSENNHNDFWHQKMVAAMQPRPYAQVQFEKIRYSNTYKHYFEEKTFKGE